jgi:hypothetical protein
MMIHNIRESFTASLNSLLRQASLIIFVNNFSRHKLYVAFTDWRHAMRGVKDSTPLYMAGSTALAIS